uniref:Uncharacterized protein n=1 Tax=Caenorhabditis japonica TaxID=281687 RepID=A0A8R1EKF9_CAEJA
MEIFINHIDVNDVDRTTLILKTLITLFSSFPLMDFSTAIQYHGKSMNEDDRLVCLLSRRVPYFVEFVLKKLLST